MYSVELSPRRFEYRPRWYKLGLFEPKYRSVWLPESVNCLYEGSGMLIEGMNEELREVPRRLVLSVGEIESAEPKYKDGMML